MKNKILQKIETAATPDFGNILSRSFDLFKKVWMESFLHVLVTMLAVIPFIIVIYIPIIPSIISSVKYGASENINPFMDYPAIMVVGYFVLLFILAIIMQGVSISIIAHFFQVCKNKDRGSLNETGGYFAFLKGNNFSKVFMLSLATFGISIAAFLLCFIPVIYVMVPLQLMIVIFAFNDKLSISDIINLSFKLGNKFWLLLFGLIVISSMIAQLGVIFCFVGLFFTAFFTHIPIYYFYKDTIGFNGDSESSEEEFSTHYNN